MLTVARCRPFLALLLSFALAVAFAATAHARVLSDGGSAPSFRGSIGDAQCGSSCSAPEFYELRNVDKPLDWPTTSFLNDYRAGHPSFNSAEFSSRTKAQEALSRRLGYERCASGWTNASCVLWDQRIPSDRSHWGTEVHMPLNADSGWGDDAIQGWNIRIWREGTDQPIFERRVCEHNNTGRPENNTDSWEPGESWNARWWLCGQTDPALGGFSKRADSTAGMLGLFAPSDISRCLSNYAGGRNGLRNSAGNIATAGQKRVPAGGRDTARPRSRGDMWRKAGPNKWVPGKDGQACYWEGADIGPRYYGHPGAPAGQYNNVGPRRDQFGTSGDSNAGLEGAGLKEAIFLSWDLGRTGKLRFQYRIDGAPDKFYAVHIVAVNWKEQTMPVFKTNPHYTAKTGTDGLNRQYFRVFAPNTTAPSIDCSDPKSADYPCTPPPLTCEDPDHDDYPCDDEGVRTPNGEPRPEVRLDLDTPVQVRETASNGVSFYQEELTGLQGVFPAYLQLQHFTPQSKYNGRNGQPAMAPNYVQEDATMANLPFASPDRSNLQQSIAPQTPALTVRSTGTGGLSQNTFSTTWMRPTLANPCEVQQVNVADSSVTEWPTDPERCTTPMASDPDGDDPTGGYLVKNAWDDYFSALGIWEASWVSDTADTPDYGRVSRPLRCNTEAVSVKDPDPFRGVYTGCPNAGNPRTPNANPTFWPLANLRKGYQTQYAQGFLIAEHPDTGRGERAAAVRVKLYTNAGDNVKQAAMWDRSNGQVVGNNVVAGDPDEPTDQRNGKEFSNGQQAVQNSSSGLKEMNFCRQGLPTGSNVYRDASDPSGDELNVPGRRGDQACAGFAVRWQWSDSENDCENRFDGQTTRPPSSFPRPTALMMNPNTRAPASGATREAVAWGVYGDEYSGSEKDYLTGAWAPDSELRAYHAALEAAGDPDRLSNIDTLPDVARIQDAKRPPYQGERPGEAFEEEACSKHVTGQWNTGVWEKEWKFIPVRDDSDLDGDGVPTKDGNCRFLQEYDQLGGGRFHDEINVDADSADGGHGTPAPDNKRPAGAPDGAEQECYRGDHVHPHDHTHSEKPEWDTSTSSWSAWTNSGAVHEQDNCHSAAFDTNTQRELCSNRHFNETQLDHHNSCHTGYTNGKTYVAPNTDKGWCANHYHDATTTNWVHNHHGEWQVDSQHQTREKIVDESSDHRTTHVRVRYGYWAYEYVWRWGSTDPYDCVDAAGSTYDRDPVSRWDRNDDGVYDLRDTDAWGNSRYAGPINNPASHGLGRTDFVWEHAGDERADEDEAKYQAAPTADAQGGRRRLGNGNVDPGYEVWRGFRYTDRMPGGPDETVGSHGTSGADARACTVIRHDGRKKAGAWVVGKDARTLFADQQTGEVPAQHGVKAEAGWGYNNTGSRVPNGTYTVQFGFDELTQAELSQGSDYCRVRGATASASGVTPRYCWSLFAEYDGREDYLYRSVVRYNDPYADPSHGVARVYGPRDGR